MVENFKSAKRNKVLFESLRQPVPDNSPGLDDCSSCESAAACSFLDLNQRVSENQTVIKELQNKSLENAMSISKLTEERRNLLKQYHRYKELVYRNEINAALHMSLQAQPGLNSEEFTYEELLSLGEKIGSVCVGYSEEEVAKISETTLDETETCSICLNPGTKGKLLLCNHFFHSECIDTWLKSKKSCPFCLCDVIIG